MTNETLTTELRDTTWYDVAPPVPTKRGAEASAVRAFGNDGTFTWRVIKRKNKWVVQARNF